jgi:molybdenum cofactor synthesis domain-containing protein
MKKVSVEEAVGQVLAYDITEVNREKGTKGRAYKRGHIILETDLEHLKSLGRRTVFIEDGNDTGIHEDDAAKMTAPLAAGANIRYDAEPVEGKISFFAEEDGVFNVDTERLYMLNMLGDTSLPCIHNNMGVTAGKQVAAFRIIPLVCDVSVMNKVKDILSEPLFSVKPYIIKKATLLITGSEVFEGKIKDGFGPILTKKLQKYKIDVVDYRIVTDDLAVVRDAVKEMAAKSDFVIITGGTSVDPDDITAQAIAEAGVKYEMKGTPIQPGNNLTLGYLGDKPVCAVPAAALHFPSTSFDILMPRIAAGEKVTREDLAKLAHGGLCHFCKKCVYPVCPFGRG